MSKRRDITQERFTPEEIAQAIRDHRGMITSAARAVGCSVATVYNYRERYPDIINAALDEARERMGDVAEESLYSMIEDVEHPDRYKATVYYLKASPEGKRRGYAERREVSGPEGGPIRAEIDPRTLSTDALREIMGALASGGDDDDTDDD